MSKKIIYNFQHLFEAHQLLLVEQEQGTLNLGENPDEAMPVCISFQENAFFLESVRSKRSGDVKIKLTLPTLIYQEDNLMKT